MNQTETQREYMTVVFKTDVESFTKNHLHIKSEFGEVLAISRGNALEEMDALRSHPAPKQEDVELIAALSETLHSFVVIMRASIKAMPEMWQVDNVTRDCDNADALIAKAMQSSGGK